MKKGLIKKIRTCKEKKKYNSYSGAEYDLYRIPGNNPLVVYNCKYCDGFHIGSKTKN